ncbi:MAG TPA: endonuclease/exonuclease/phosphatase family protein [Pyrinomonadaceae bacterium]|nr:endonuclease/exonuclease/phosphatase family protein [Pyrinomonadaceae bacterium]
MTTPLIIPPLTDSEKLEFGENSDHQALANDNKLVVTSYNIRYARGPYLISGGLRRKLGLMNLARRPQHVGRMISAAARAFTDGRLLPRADVIALQEADKGTVRTGGHHVAKELAEEMGMHWVHAPAGIPRGVAPAKRQWWLDFEEPIGVNDSGDTGVALLSRLPLNDVTRIDLPWQECPHRPRLAMSATIALGSNEIRLFNAHVDPHMGVGGQLAQLEAIAEQAEASTGPTIVLGDFNTLSKQKCLDTRGFLEARGYTTPLCTGTATWRGAGLRMHADWIFTRGLKIQRWGVARLLLNVSDHWPIWAEVVL